jgi:hypothetical protein
MPSAVVSDNFETSTGAIPKLGGDNKATCSAWVNFDGTTNTGGNCTIRSQHNVSSVTDNGTADYTINFTTAMADTSYCWVGSSGMDSVYQNNVVSGKANTAYTSWKQSSSFRVELTYANQLKNTDSIDVSLQVFSS